jgi:HEAT repeat protein
MLRFSNDASAFSVGARAAVILSCVLLTLRPSVADEVPVEKVVTSVAGLTLDQCAEQMGSEDRVVRLRAVRTLAPFGAAAAEVLRDALDHEDAAVRFVAAEQLGRLGGDSLEAAVGRLCELVKDESSHAVRLAASFALCRHGLLDENLPLLLESLDFPERGMACTAAYLIGEVGPEAAEAAEGPLKRTAEANRAGEKQGDYHLGGAANHALQKILSKPSTN